MAINAEVQGVLFWSYVTENGIKNEPSQFSDHDTKTTYLATTEARVLGFIKEIAEKVLPDWYDSLPALKSKNITKADLDKIAKQVSDILKDPEPEKIHTSMLAIQHIPTMADDRPTTQSGNRSAVSVLAEAWPQFPYAIKATAPAYDRDANGVIDPATFRKMPVDIYVDQRVQDEFVTQLKPNVPTDEWARMASVFHDADAWIDENAWGWRVIQLTGFKISKGAAGLKVGFYPNKLSFNNKAVDYPSSVVVGPQGGARQSDDL